MADTTFDGLTADQIMGTSPISGTDPIDYTLSQNVADMANSYLAKGMTQEQAVSNIPKSIFSNHNNKIAFSYNPTTGTFEAPQENVGSSGPLSAEEMMFLSPSQASTDTPNYRQQTQDAEDAYLADGPSIAEGLKDFWSNEVIPAAKTASSDIATRALHAGAALTNWSASHEMQDAKPLTKDQFESAKFAGLLPQDAQYDKPNLQAIVNDPNAEGNIHWQPGVGWTLGKTLAMSPDKIKEMSAAWVAKHGGDAKGLAERIAKSEDPNSGYIDPAAITLRLGPVLTDLTNPAYKPTVLQDTLNLIAKANTIASNPSAYDKGQVAQAQQILSYWKEQKGKGVLADTKDFFKMLATNPLGVGKSLVTSTLEQPEYLLLGAGGDMGLAAKAAEAAGTASKAVRLARIANVTASDGASNLAKGIANTAATRSATMENLANNAASTAQKYKAASNLVKPVSASLVGGGINVITQGAQQDVTEGVRHSQAGAFVQGAVLGAVPALLARGEKVLPKAAEDKTIFEPTPETVLEVPPEVQKAAETVASKKAPDTGNVEPVMPTAEELQGQLEKATSPSAVHTSEAGYVTPDTLKKLALFTGAAGTGATLGALYGPGKTKEQKLTDMGVGAAGLVAGMLGMHTFSGDLSRPMSFGGKELGIFGGKRGAGWSLADEAAANKIEREGASPEKIWAAYGLVKDKTGNWMREEVDPDMEVKVPGPSMRDQMISSDGVPLNDLVKNSAFQKLYPNKAKELKVTWGHSERPGGFFNNSKNEIHVQGPIHNWKTILRHELQHAVQDIEDWPRGYNMDMFARQLMHAREQAIIEHRIFRAFADDALAEGNVSAAMKYQRRAEAATEIPAFGLSDEQIAQRSYEMYRETYGEELARLTEVRSLYADMMKEQGDSFVSKKSFPEVGEEDSAHHIIKNGRVAKSEESGTSNILPNEKEIVERARRGDPRAIADLYNHYKPIMVRTIQKMLTKNGRPNIGPKLGLEAEDIVNEVFHNALEKLPQFEGKSSFYTWLHKSAINHTLNKITQAKRLPDQVSIFKGEGRDANDLTTEGANTLGEGRIMEDPHASSGLRSDVEGQQTLSPEDQMMNEVLGKRLKQALGQMPDDIRRALIDHDINGMTFQEIADKEGISAPAAFKRVQRGHVIGKSILTGKERGSVDPDLLIKFFKYGIVPAGGALFGMQLAPKEDKAKWAVYGAVAGLMAGHMPMAETARNIRTLLGHPNHVNINSLTGTYDAIITGGDRQTAQIISRIKTLVPNKDDRVAVTHWLEGNHTIPLSANQKLAASELQHFYRTLGVVGQSVGLFGELLPNFVNHEWLTDKGDWTRHNVKRKISTYAEGIDAGMTPRTLDAADLAAIYGRDTFRAIASKHLLGQLAKFDMGKGALALVPADKAPYDYITINHPALRGKAVSPNIAPSLEFIYKNQYGPLGEAIATLNSSVKRVTFGFSMFHVFTLGLVHLTTNPFMHSVRSLKEIAQSAAGKTNMQKLYMSGGYGDMVDLAQHSGLMITAKKGGTVVDQDMNNGLHEGLQSFEGFVNSIPIAGWGLAKGVRGLDNIFKLQDKFVWENVHAGLKLQAFHNMFNTAKLNHLKVAAKDPTYKVPSDLEIGTKIAGAVNDMYGGLNWRRTMDDATTQAGRVLAYTLNKPKSRTVAQIAIFAPDWTASTIRTFVKSLPQSFNIKAGLKGLVSPKLPQDFYRQYILRNSILYFAAYNALNMAMVGHPIWQNTDAYGNWDPFDIQLGNGETIQPNKHFFETPNLIMEPKPWLLGKMGPLPKEVMEQLMGLEYLSAHGESPKMKESSISHAAKMWTPISLDSWQRQGKWSALLSLFMQVKHHATADEIAHRKAAARHNRSKKQAAHTQALIGD